LGIALILTKIEGGGALALNKRRLFNFLLPHSPFKITELEFSSFTLFASKPTSSTT